MTPELISNHALEAITPKSLGLYARALGWEYSEPFGETSDVYLHQTYGEILLPRTQNIGDYLNAVSRAFQSFVRVTEDSELATYQAIIGSEFDVIRFATDSIEDGSVYFDDALSLHNQAKEALLAAACATNNPNQAVYRLGANKEASTYLEKVRLAQSERGSYVIKLHSPVPPKFQVSLFDDEPYEDQPFARQVTTNLMNALEQSKLLVERAVIGNPEDIAEFLKHGISANLCESIGNILQKSNNLKVSTTWSKARPRKEPMKSVKFNESSSEYFKEIARVLKQKVPQRDVTLMAAIHKLARQGDSETGKIYFNAVVEDERRTISAELNEQSYTQAIVAHEGREMIEISGDLERVGSRWQMNRATITGVTTTNIEDGN